MLEKKKEDIEHLIPPFTVASAYYLQKEIKSFAHPVKRYSMTAKELTKITDPKDYGKEIREYYVRLDDIKLVYEPKNKHDPNAIMVTNHGVKVGYVPAEMCTEVKKILKKYDIDYIKARTTGGRSKYLIAENEVEKRNYGIIEIKLYITLKKKETIFSKAQDFIKNHNKL